MAEIFKGYSSPVRKRQLGFFTPFTGSDTIRASVIHILGTHIGERVHLIDFGSRLQELVFEPDDDAFVTLAQTFINEALRRWEPRIDLLSTEVILKPTTNKADILITYRIRGPVQQEDVLSFQFSRTGGIVV